jgi:hypothetical protein
MSPEDSQPIVRGYAYQAEIASFGIAEAARRR